MSRYLIDGILNDVGKGEDVVITSVLLWESERLLHEVINAVDTERWVRIVRANGNRSATHVDGGTVRAVACTASLRGLKPDVLLVLDHRHFSPGQLEEFRHAATAMAATGTEVQLMD